MKRAPTTQRRRPCANQPSLRLRARTAPRQGLGIGWSDGSIMPDEPAAPAQWNS